MFFRDLLQLFKTLTNKTSRPVASKYRCVFSDTKMEKKGEAVVEKI